MVRKKTLTFVKCQPCASGKEPSCNAENQGSIPRWGKSPEERLATHSSILAYRIPWTEEPSRQQFVGSQRVRQDLATNSFTFKCLFALEISLSYPALLPAKSTCLHLMKPLRTSREFFTAFLHGSQSSAPQWKFYTSWKTFSAVLPWIHFQLHELGDLV